MKAVVVRFRRWLALLLLLQELRGEAVGCKGEAGEWWPEIAHTLPLTACDLWYTPPGHQDRTWDEKHLRMLSAALWKKAGDRARKGAPA
jgi:hypothetical protein